MNIGLDHEEISGIIEEIKRELKYELKQKALKIAEYELERYMRGGQFIGEIRNQLVKEMAPGLSNKILKNFEESKVLSRALESAEARINATIHKKMINGLVVKFGDIKND